jgi:hypothetical protein
MTWSQIIEKKILKYIYFKRMWEPKEEIVFNLAHKVAKKIIHAKWKKTLFGYGLVLILEKTNNLILVQNLVPNLVPKIRFNSKFNKLLIRTKINDFDWCWLVLEFWLGYQANY